MGSPRKNRPEAGVALGKNSAGASTPAALAAELGLAVDQVEQLVGETCVAGEDFNDIAGETVFTVAGLQRIRARIQEQMLGTVTPSAAGPTGADNVVDFGTPPLRREPLKLTRVFPWSTNLLADRENGLEVVVSVRNATHLKPGMVLEDCAQGDTGWFYDGRLPRTIGEEQLYYPAKNPATKGKK